VRLLIARERTVEREENCRGGQEMGWWLELENLVLVLPSPGQNGLRSSERALGRDTLLQPDVNPFDENFSIVAMDVKCCVVLSIHSYNI
jgi:hypothetical protein